jgi:hypothetical protein
MERMNAKTDPQSRELISQNSYHIFRFHRMKRLQNAYWNSVARELRSSAGGKFSVRSAHRSSSLIISPPISVRGNAWEPSKPMIYSVPPTRSVSHYYPLLSLFIVLSLWKATGPCWRLSLLAVSSTQPTTETVTSRQIPSHNTLAQLQL